MTQLFPLRRTTQKVRREDRCLVAGGEPWNLQADTVFVELPGDVMGRRMNVCLALDQ